MPSKTPQKRQKFGQPIQFQNYPPKTKTGAPAEANLQGANAMISQFVNVKKNYKKRLNELTAGDIHAQRFLCENDCAFMFDVGIMKTLIAAAEAGNPENPKKPDSAVIVLFQGLKKIQLGAGKGCAFGLPTLIATVYTKYGNENYKHVKIRKEHFAEDYVKELADVEPPFDGFQHPGNGNSESLKFTGDEFEDVTANVAKPPRVLRYAAKDEYDTDFVILPELDVAFVKEWYNL